MGNRNQEESGLRYQWLSSADLHYISELDRSEQIRRNYEVEDGILREIEVNIDVPRWYAEGDSGHTVPAKIAGCQDDMDRRAVAMGAFAGSQFVGIGVLRPRLRGSMAQLTFLHVSRGYRRKGIAAKLTEELFAVARDRGATSVYVSSTPSESAVGFYRQLGFELADEVDPELYALEPDDIHLVKSL